MAQFGAPNFLSVIDAYEAGARRAERSRLQELDTLGRELQGKALAGDQNALAQLGQVNPQAYMQTKQFSTEQKKQFLQDFARSAYDANTPEKYAAVVQRFKSQGHNFDPGEDAFENRQSMINQVIDIGDRMGMDLRREESRRAQANADRSYALDVQQFNAGQRNADRNYELQAAQLALKDPDLVEIYDEQTGQPYKARYNAKTGGYDRVGGVKAPNGTQLEVGPDGTVSFTQGMGKPPNEGQSKDIGFLTRMTGAMDSLDKNEGALLSLGENVGSRAPIVGNYMKSPQYQQAEQAGSEFLTGLLRKDSGGAITPAEDAFYGSMYLPKPGDSKEVLTQKREARKRAALGIKMGLPAHLIANMEKSGVDFTKLAPSPDASGKGSKGDAPRIRTYNPATDELE